MLWRPAIDHTMPVSTELTLKLIEEHRILDEAAGLNEPSGLTLNADGSALYTVSDDTKAVFKLDLKGRLSITGSFFVGVDDLEGIAISADGQKLLMVQEETNSIITIELESRRELSRRPLAGMENYNTISHYFPDPPDNKGLEGITVNTRNNHVFVVKEGRPGVLIEVSADQRSVLGSRLLSGENGFKHPKIGQDKLDFSGLSYDRSRHDLDHQRQRPVPVPLRLEPQQGFAAFRPKRRTQRKNQANPQIRRIGHRSRTSAPVRGERAGWPPLRLQNS